MHMSTQQNRMGQWRRWAGVVAIVLVANVLVIRWGDDGSAARGRARPARNAAQRGAAASIIMRSEPSALFDPSACEGLVAEFVREQRTRDAEPKPVRFRRSRPSLLVVRPAGGGKCILSLTGSVAC